MATKMDHLVIGAKDLAQGVGYVKHILGVEMPFGGVHELMGTHNHLMRLGEDVFLEVIAANPHIKSSGHPRWYGLDDPFVREQLEKSPVLLSWVVRTDDIHGLTKSCDQFSFGRPTEVSRGDLTWYFGLPEDGRLLAGGMAPYVMQWQADTHPASRMADLGCRLQQIEIYHPHVQWMETVLKSINADSFVRLIPLPDGKSPYIVAYIDTPDGTRMLCGCGCQINSEA
jgi:hypothetical protein